MLVNLEQIISEVKENVASVAIWTDYDLDTYKNYDRVERMRSKAFDLQIKLEMLLDSIIKNGEEKC